MFVLKSYLYVCIVGLQILPYFILAIGFGIIGSQRVKDKRTGIIRLGRQGKLHTIVEGEIEKARL